MERAGHALKGSLANLAAKSASAIAGELEMLGISGDLSHANLPVQHLEDELILVAGALDSMCPEASA
jgi:HPt (histidine-containing phosphotransfer) domain-containing protein